MHCFLARLSVIVISESVTRHVDFQQRLLCSMDFSVDRLNAMDHEMTSEFQKIFKIANVSCRSDFTETALMKLTKNQLVKIIGSSMNLAEKNIEFCKSAAGKIDVMKSEKIADQKLIIETQQGQMNSVQETVKSEMKSWTDVVKKNTAQRPSGKPLTENSIKQAVRTVNEEKKRSTNLMIYGCQESDKEADFELNKAVKDILNGTDAFPVPRTGEVYRIGRKEPGKNRPIKVEFGCASEVDSILMRARNLRDSDVFKHVYLGPDRTKEEQLAHSKLVKEMKQMIQKDSNKHYFIRDRKICTADKTLSSQTSQSS